MGECPICQSGQTVPSHRLHDDRFGYAGTYQLRTCGDCGHGYLENAEFTDEQIQRLYSDYYPRKSMRIEDYRPHVERRGFLAWLDGANASAFRWVPRGVRILDVGSGFGQALGYHAARGCEVWGVESDENALRVAEKNGFNVRIGVFDPKDFPASHFDVVTLDQVIEHMRNPVEAMSGIRSVLKPGGFAVISTPNAKGWGGRVFGRRWINWHTPYHLHFFSRSSMQMAARRAGLEAQWLGTVTPSEWLRYQWIHLVTMPQQGQRSRFWTGAGGYSPIEWVAIKLISVAHRLRINHFMTRLADAAGSGDSQLFLLRRA